ncbi:MAG: hypothetical protein M3Y21_05715, partial [Candidatus Eremiobacteraeota bacterium]|nr:hypothetical protein [Candidatus Eremiobacteraeota bacterium]
GDRPGIATLTISAKDTVGDVIGGTDPYYLPITISTTDTSGHVTASPALPAKITAPGQSITLSYDGKSAAKFFPIDSAVAGDSIVNPVSTNAGALALTQSAGEYVYVSTQSDNAVYVYAAGPAGSNTLARKISGPATTIANPVMLAVDTNGALYVVNYQRDVTVYAPGADGNAAPIMTFAGGAGHPESIELVGGQNPVTTGRSNVADAGTTTAQYYNDIYQAAPAGGGFISSSSPQSGLSAYSKSPANGQVCWAVNPAYDNPWTQCFDVPVDGKAMYIPQYATSDLKFRSDGFLVDLQTSRGHVATYAVPTSNPNWPNNLWLTPTYDLGGPSTQLSEPHQVAFDKAGNMYIANYGSGTGQGSMTVYAPNATGDTAPLRTIGGFTYLTGVAVGP